MGTGEWGTETGNGDMEWNYGATVGVAKTFVELEGEGERDDMGAPPRKRACLDPKPHPLQPNVVHIPSQQVQRHSGGRGFKRFRTRRALESECGVCVE